jgi:hippurate hydrolase
MRSANRHTAKYGGEKGFTASICGPMLEKNAVGSRANEFYGEIQRAGSCHRREKRHCADAPQGIDAMEIGCRAGSTSFMQWKKQELPADEYRLLKFGRMESGKVRNTISGSTVLGGISPLFS